MSDQMIVGDSIRYLEYANNLSKGFYTDVQDPFLRNGPGYPLYLLPFEILRAPQLVIVIGHVVLSFAAVLFFFHTLRLYLSFRAATFFSYCLGLYPVYLINLPKILSESLTLVLVTGFLYLFLTSLRAETFLWKRATVAGVFLGMLLLTKFFFGYVAIAVLVICGVIFSWTRSSMTGRSVFIMIVGIVCFSPYLVYTYSLTDRMFYFGTNGGGQLYWMTSSLDGEHGNWISSDKVFNLDEYNFDETHRDFYRSLEGLSRVERDDALRAQALVNLKANPTHYLKNWIASVSRLLFGFPYSFKMQTPRQLFFVVSNSLWIVPLLFSTVPAWHARKQIPEEIWLATGFVAVYLGGVSLISSIGRNMIPAMPFILLWLSIIYCRILRIDLRGADS